MRIIAANPKLRDLMIDFLVPLVESQKHFILGISTAGSKLR